MKLKQKNIIIFYIFISVFELFSELYFENGKLIHYLTKPLLLPALALLFFVNTSNANNNSEKYLMFLALFFAWLGDVLLMFSKNSNFFLLGLGAFLIMQLLYGYVFSITHKFKFGKSKFLWFLIVFFFCIGAAYVLYPNLNDLKIPVIVYFLCINFMVFSAFCNWDFKTNSASRSIFIGAVLFLVSDTAIAFNKFHSEFFGAGFIIMFTYILSQYLIVYGYSKFISEK